MCPNLQDMMRQIILLITTLGLSSMVLGQSIEVVLFQETGLEEATQTALTNYAEQTGVEMTFYEEVLDYSANSGNIQPCTVMDSILSQKDVAIFLGGTKPQHCNWADIVPQLHQFVVDGGTLIFQGPNADGGMAFFFEPDQWEQFDDSPWFGDIDDSQHWCCGLGVENANCGGGQELFGVSHIDHPIFSGAYNYPSGQQGICDMMIFEPSWYSLGAADLNDSRFFSILEFGQALNTDWVHEGEDTQMIFGKSVGAGHVVFYGENNPLPDPYTGSQTLLGNMIVYFSEEPGCTNENACNYDPEANVDDGSCLYDSGVSWEAKLIRKGNWSFTPFLKNGTKLKRPQGSGSMGDLAHTSTYTLTKLRLGQITRPLANSRERNWRVCFLRPKTTL